MTKKKNTILTKKKKKVTKVSINKEASLQILRPHLFFTFVRQKDATNFTLSLPLRSIPTKKKRWDFWLTYGRHPRWPMSISYLLLSFGFLWLWLIRFKRLEPLYILASFFCPSIRMTVYLWFYPILTRCYVLMQGASSLGHTWRISYLYFSHLCPINYCFRHNNRSPNI